MQIQHSVLLALLTEKFPSEDFGTVDVLLALGECITVTPGDNCALGSKGLFTGTYEITGGAEVECDDDLGALTIEFDLWCETEGKTPRSAEELLLEEGITSNQTVWLLDFIERWDAACAPI